MNTLLKIVLICLIVAGIYYVTRDSTVHIQNETTPQSTQNTDEIPATPSPEGDDSVILNEDQGEASSNSLGKEITLPQENATWTISYSNTGFSPKTLTIKKGDSVRFVNNSDIDLWIDSDTSLLDSNRPLISGEMFSYTFSTSGNWDFFNKSKTSSTGTIQVK